MFSSIVAKVLKAIGVVSSDKVSVIRPSDLIDRWEGGTPDKADKKVRQGLAYHSCMRLLLGDSRSWTSVKAALYSSTRRIS
jgi:hypothetical protein